MTAASSLGMVQGLGSKVYTFRFWAQGLGFREMEPTSPTANAGIPWVLPPLTNSWIILIVGLYIALNMTPNIDCY